MSTTYNNDKIGILVVNRGKCSQVKLKENKHRVSTSRESGSTVTMFETLEVDRGSNGTREVSVCLSV